MSGSSPPTNTRAHLVADIVGGNAGGVVEVDAARQDRCGGDGGITGTDTVRERHLGFAPNRGGREAIGPGHIPHAGFEIRLAGSGNPRTGTAAGGRSRRNSLGVMPISALKARLKGPSELKPASSAMVRIGGFYPG